MMAKRSHLYIGKSGQLVVMAEFLARGYNVAMPEVDVGDDIFVVRDRDGQLSRIQVKTATGQTAAKGFRGQFRVSLRQLFRPLLPELQFVFVVRHQQRWEDFVLLSRPQLLAEHEQNAIGSRAEGHLVLRMYFQPQRLLCSRRSLQRYRNDWSQWPSIVP